jgi:hypothetical protein
MAGACAVAIVLPALWLIHSLALAARSTPATTDIRLEIPETLKMEHLELHAKLVLATQAGGRTGKAAQAVAEALHPHFVKEEEYALPPLALLPRLSRGKVTPEMRRVLPLTDRLKAELPQMLRERKG